MTFPIIPRRHGRPALLLIASVAAACTDDPSTTSTDSGSVDAATTSADSGADVATTSADSGADAATTSSDSGVSSSGGTCEAEQTCDFKCSEGCQAECLGSRCTATCDEGGCSLDADFNAVASFDCAGGGCSIDCDGASECSVNCGGGGCQVGCDGESSCDVSCGDTGAPCQVICEAGAVASCDNDHCEISGCQVCDASMIDESYKPSLDPARFTTVIDNPLYPLPVGGRWVYESEEEIITIVVMRDTYTTATGVECLVVHDQAKNKAGQVIEDTLDYFAQDLDGNVWYFGEETAEYVNGVKANTRGSWEAGVDGALPGIVMYKTPVVGTKFREEYYRCEAEDMAEILSLGETVKVPAGEYTNCVKIRDFNPLDPRANEHKFYCPGVGIARVDEIPDGESEFAPAESLKTVELP